MELKWSPLTFEDFAEDIRIGKPYSFARYGDGEWGWITGRPVRNRDGHQMFNDGNAELQHALLSCPQYRLGNMGVLRDWETRGRVHVARWARTMDWILAHNLGNVEWCDNLIWITEQVRAARASERFPLLDVLREKRVVMVGPQHLFGLNDKVLSLARFIAVRQPDCYLDIDRVEAEVIHDWRHTAAPIRTVYLFSCCFTANLLIARLHDIVGQDSWLLDCGSIWEPYVGKTIRGYQAKLKTSGHWPPIT